MRCATSVGSSHLRVLAQALVMKAVELIRTMPDESCYKPERRDYENVSITYYKIYHKISDL